MGLAQRTLVRPGLVAVCLAGALLAAPGPAAATPVPGVTDSVPQPPQVPPPEPTVVPPEEPAPEEPAPPAGIDPDFHGVNAQGVFRAPRETWDAHLSAIAGAGFGVVRRDAFWSDAEPRPPVDGVHTWRWTRHDAVAEALARHGLRWYPILDYGTPWATSVTGPRAWMAPPDDPADYAAYAAAFAARYGRGGSFWAEHPELTPRPVLQYEIWNEPNLEQFWPDQTTAPERYAELLVGAADAVHAVDPRARVVVGGLSSIGMAEFLERMGAHVPGVWAAVDAIGFHPYGGTPDITYARLRTAREALRALGIDRPLEVTETGWASPPTPEERRAAHLARIAAELPHADCGVTRLLVHTWITAEDDPSEPEQWFGIADPAGGLDASAAAYAAGTARARGGAVDVAPICAP